MENKNAYAYISIVAIVAIVAVVMMMSGGSKTTTVSSPSFSGGDLIGEAIKTEMVSKGDTSGRGLLNVEVLPSASHPMWQSGQEIPLCQGITEDTTYYLSVDVQTNARIVLKASPYLCTLASQGGNHLLTSTSTAVHNNFIVLEGSNSRLEYINIDAGSNMKTGVRVQTGSKVKSASVKGGSQQAVYLENGGEIRNSAVLNCVKGVHSNGGIINTIHVINCNNGINTNSNSQTTDVTINGEGSCATGVISSGNLNNVNVNGCDEGFRLTNQGVSSNLRAENNTIGFKLTGSYILSSSMALNNNIGLDVYNNVELNSIIATSNEIGLKFNADSQSDGIIGNNLVVSNNNNYGIDASGENIKFQLNGGRISNNYIGIYTPDLSIDKKVYSVNFCTGNINLDIQTHFVNNVEHRLDVGTSTKNLNQMQGIQGQIKGSLQDCSNEPPTKKLEAAVR